MQNLTSPTKTHVRDFRSHPSGRRLRRRRFRSNNTPSSRRWGYKNIPGHPAWPNRDPLTERGGVNLYALVENNPINLADKDGAVKYNDLLARVDKLDKVAKKLQLCCSCEESTYIRLGLKGTANGTKVTETMQIYKYGCKDQIVILEFWWWDCGWPVGIQSRSQCATSC